MNRLELDDTDSRIGYEGAWTLLQGSSRQWQSTTHTTTQTGAFASINFQGTRVVVYITVPIGSGSEVRTTVTLDGKQTTTSHQSNTTATYNFILFDSGPISNTPHTVLLANAGSAQDSPLQFDRFHLEGDNFNVSPVTVAVSVAPSATLNSPQGGTSTVSTPGSSQLSGISAVFSGRISSGNPSGTSVPPTVSRSTELQSAASSKPIGGVFGQESGGLQNLAVPQSVKDTAVALPFQTSLLDVPTSILSISFVTTTEADGTVVTNTVASSPTTYGSPARASVDAATIAGSIVGGVVFFILFALFMLRLFRRRSEKWPVMLYDKDENATSPESQGSPSASTVTPFHHDALHQGFRLTVNVKGQGHDTCQPMSPRSRSEKSPSVVGSPNSIEPTIFSRTHQISPLNERHSDTEPNNRPYVYLPRLDQLTDTGSVPIGSSVMLLLMDSEPNHLDAELPPSYQATV